ncbi:hypothetical protein IFM58399_00233 [Aspergillus lentulus]|uniref:Uncharacterized protein n=1 Tax=Aspergillus lentulus TaxID=293939 RepID=A0ABQ0ZR52_ASPLE|nr:uncharacterized protein IFM58399_00233 [Aspergillus lentulus]KAF4169543.1 hypothetical protein CNMCM6936_007526 [Aspergillus lentulus]KAF4184000.1 hypothetical protein CNMCM7927_008464 [Aspergillus lentulus]GFF23274.1 hypothetical protein IFM58399_00233 [Aspergillus lentulus]GFF51780.1 hypothetical protein IFM62136_01883 [Aspergillus lentulus]GFF61341.1 hypothetical protein IFM60648_00232 [Aspergillus lentulus]
MLAAPMPPLPSHLHPPSDANRTDAHTISQTSCQAGIASTNMSCGVSSNAAGDRRSNIPQRPKLTLQTKSLPMTFGSSTTGLSLSLAAGATASPTVRNTFRNAYDVSSCPPSATVSPSKSSISRFGKPSSPYPTNANGNPYQQPLGVKSILRNSPLEPTARRRSISVAPNGPNGGSSSRRMFFPAEKRVSYRYPLEEEITTVHYTARHSDLTDQVEHRPSGEAGSGEDSDTNSSRTSSDINTSDEDEHRTTSQSQRDRKKRKPLAAERQIRAVALLDGLETDPYGSSTPQTPGQRRVKRRCEWRWTLGPLEKRNELIQVPQTPEDASSKLLVANATPASDVSTYDDKDTESLTTSDSEDSRSSSASERLSSPTSSVASPEGKVDGSNTNQALETEPPDTDRSESLNYTTSPS